MKLSLTGDVLWSRTFGGAGSESDSGPTTGGELGLATAPDCGIVISGAFEQTVDFGTGPKTSAGASDIFVARLSP